MSIMQINQCFKLLLKLKTIFWQFFYVADLFEQTDLFYFLANFSFDYSAKATEESVNESLKCMQLEYIDLIQIHDVEYAPDLKTIVEETIPCLMRLKQKGLVRSIGITGNS